MPQWKTVTATWCVTMGRASWVSPCPSLDWMWITIMTVKPEHVPLNLPSSTCIKFLSMSLEFFSLQITTSLEQVREFLSGTLLFVQQEHLCPQRSLWEEVQQCVDLLKDKGFITVTMDSLGQILQVTRLGKATYKGKVSTLPGSSLSLNLPLNHTWTTIE